MVNMVLEYSVKPSLNWLPLPAILRELIAIDSGKNYTTTIYILSIVMMII